MLNKRKIMIVEDEFIIADKLEEMLSNNGYAVSSITNNYLDTIEQLNKELPDLALLDIKIKGEKDGIELAGYIYSHFNIPVIFLSAFTDTETMLRAKEAHPNTFIIKSKPILKENVLLEAFLQQLLVSINFAMPELSKNNKIKNKGFFRRVKEINPLKKIEATMLEDLIDKKLLLLFDEIIFIESYSKIEKNTVLIHSIQKEKNKAFVLRCTLENVECQLPEHFIRIHDSYIINLNKITGSRPQQIIIEENFLNIGEKYRKTVHEKIRRLIGH